LHVSPPGDPHVFTGAIYFGKWRLTPLMILAVHACLNLTLAVSKS
jgi:hypothetical protein